MSDVDTQRYAWLLTCEPLVQDPSEEALFEVKGPPVDWLIVCFFATQSLVTGFASVALQIECEVNLGAQRCRINSFTSQEVIPGVGAVYTAFGHRVYVKIASNTGALRYQLNVWAIPKPQVNQGDVEKVPVDSGIFGIIPPFSTAVSADPPFQTVEILDAGFAVIQTISLQGQLDFAPLDPLGFFMRNTGAVDTLFVFKRKNYL